MNYHDDDSLYSVFFQVVRIHYHRIHEKLDKVGIYPGQPPLLLSLLHNDGQSQKELADKIKIRPSTITVMLRRMQKTGLLERRHDLDDMRISRVYLTEKGKKSCEEIDEAMKILREECFRKFTEEEQVLLKRLLMQMRDNLSFKTKD